MESEPENPNQLELHTAEFYKHRAHILEQLGKKSRHWIAWNNGGRYSCQRLIKEIEKNTKLGRKFLTEMSDDTNVQL